jgi:hypothetical protein
MSEGVIVLVYYRVRGKLQPIRNLLAYLGQPFVEVHWGDEQQNRSLPQHVKDTLRSIRVDKASLPLLVFEEMVLYDLYPILAYLCRRFKREDLLGRDIRQRVILTPLRPVFKKYSRSTLPDSHLS